jgi:hypothetical protein
LRLRFKAREVHALARRYRYSAERPLVAIGRRARARGHLTAQELRTIARWKTPRSAPRVARNSDDFVRALTAVMLSTKSERLRVEVLTLLQGVNWPTASVILHFVHPDRYPILDVRALWSMGFSRPPVYNFEFWAEYVAFTRREARRLKVGMRELDRALWQYSKERQ